MIHIDPDFLRQNKPYVIGLTTMKELLNRPLNPGSNALLICQSGWAVANVYFKNYLFKKGDILILTENMTPVFLRVSDDFSTFYCIMSQVFSDEVCYHISMYFYTSVYVYPVLKLSEDQTEALWAWQKQILWIEQNQSHVYRQTLVKNCLESLYLTLDYKLQKIVENREKNITGRQEEILRRFFLLITKHAGKHHNVAFYARELCITPYYLSTVTTKYTNMSPKEAIDNQIILELKKIAGTTNIPVNRIAEQMHFEDPAYLGRFFRRHTGMSLTEYRRKYSI